MGEFLGEDVAVVLLVLHPVGDMRGLFLQQLSFMLTQLHLTLRHLIQHTVQSQHPLSLIPLDLETPINITLDMNKVLIQVAIIVACTIEHSFNFPLLLFNLDHLEPILKQSILLNVVENVLAESLELSDDLVVCLLALLDELLSGNGA